VKRTIATCLVIVLTTLAGAAAARAQAITVTTNEQIPFSLIDFVPCANGGAGEEVLVTGTLHVLTHVTIDARGGLHVKLHVQPQGASGIGLTTGDTYRGTGVTQEHFNFNASGGFTDTFINNFRLIGQGPGNNLLVHQTIHVTVTPNGDVTSEVENTSVECR
jgi:hypothetical protein